MSMRLLVLGVCFLLTSVLAVTSVRLLRRWRTRSFLGVLLINVLVLTFLLAYGLLMLEGYHFLFVQSDGFGTTLANKRWRALHWKPINGLGFRDEELSPEGLQNRHVVAVIGDSLTAGSGIRDYRQRYSNVLGRRLGERYRVVNVAKPGWDTAKELKTLRNLPFKPDTVILQYYLNDIKDAVLAHGGEWFLRSSPPEGLFGVLVARSYFINYLYWHYSRSRISIRRNSALQRMQDAYGTDQIWETHASVIRELVEYTRDEHIRLLVVVFPNYFSMDESAPMTHKVSAFFERLEVEAVDLTPIFAGRDPRELVCNAQDGHPNERAHAEVAGLLFERLREDGPP